MQAQQEQLQQQMAQFQQQSLQLVSSGAPVSTQLPEGGSLNVSGIPRVPSLDLLRQIVTQQQQQYQSSPAPNSKPPTTSAAVVKEGQSPPLWPSSRGRAPVLSTVPCSLQIQPSSICQDSMLGRSRLATPEPELSNQQSQTLQMRHLVGALLNIQAGSSAAEVLIRECGLLQRRLVSRFPHGRRLETP